MAPEATPPTEEHQIGALLLAVASLSHTGFVRMNKPTSAGWRVLVYHPRAQADHQAITVVRGTLREALEAAWTALREQTGKTRPA